MLGSKRFRLGLAGGAGLMATTVMAEAQQNAATIFPKAQIDQLLKTPSSFYDRTLAASRKPLREGSRIHR